MSTATRIISGSAASWARIGLTLVSQLALVPIYLSYWSAEIYGIWIAVLAVVDMLSTVDKGHQNYLGFEFLKLGEKNRKKISLFLGSGVWFAVALGLLQVGCIIVLLSTGLISKLLGEAATLDAVIIKEAGIVLLLQSISWLVCGSIGGLLGRSLAVFGHYPRVSWWQVAGGVVKLIAPVIAVVSGAGLLTTGLVAVIAYILFYIFFFANMLSLLKKEKITYSSSFSLGWSNLVQSFMLSVRDFLQGSRQQGVRIMLAPLAGATKMAAFATMRTGANAAFQGLNTVTHPLMPELMRFLRLRDQARSEAAFGTVWIVVVALIAPAVVVAQVLVEPIYVLWTQGKFTFDPLLFATLSLSVLVYAVSQPAVAVVRGNNILKPQLILSGISSVAVIGGIILLVPQVGISGAGIALLTAEIVSTTGYRWVAQRWLHNNGLEWPKRPALIASTSVIIAAIAMLTMVWAPELRWIILLIALLLLYWNLVRYWKVLPPLATKGAKQIINRIPLVKNRRAA